ncbi:hypothetical protein [Yoonia sp.]|uniref:hypothetical protein n=1 Tax=Yoonia sp. TaxID=2212373 RepID=UPI00344DC65F
MPQLRPGLAAEMVLVAEYIVNRRAAAYLPARHVKKYLDSGHLHLVPDAPRFPYPVWATVFSTPPPRFILV